MRDRALGGRAATDTRYSESQAHVSLTKVSGSLFVLPSTQTWVSSVNNPQDYCNYDTKDIKLIQYVIYSTICSIQPCVDRSFFLSLIIYFGTIRKKLFYLFILFIKFHEVRPRIEPLR